MKRRFLGLFCALALCLGLTPATALAEGGDAPERLCVGNQVLGSGTSYWTTDPETGELARYTDGGDAWNVQYSSDTATLTLKDATIKTTHTNSQGAVIYAQSAANSAVSLTIHLEGTNTIECDTAYYGIYVEAERSGESHGRDASLTITGDGSLEASGSSYGILVKSGTGNASLTINDASVKANTTSTSSYFAGVYVMSSSNATGSPELSLAVNGGSLTASGGTSSDGIQFYVGDPNATNAITSLTVSGNAIVDARAGGIKATRVSTVLPTPTPTGENSSGIVFDGTEGTVYGDVTLDESLTIAEGETLTIPEGSTLNTNGNLANNGAIVDAGSTLTGELGGIIVTAPAITTESLPEGTAGQPYTATLEATGNNITWSASGLPAGLTLDADTGAISGTPTTDGQFPVTVTATNGAGSIDRAYTLNIKPAFVSVAGLKLSSESLTLQEKDSDTLTATVEPADATNKSVTWESSDTDIATVGEDGTVTAVSAGSATITATAADGSGVSASCEVTVTHGDMVQTQEKDATCTADGTEEYWTCGICGNHYKDEGGTVPTIPEENVIPKTGHAWGEAVYTWSDDGKTATATFTCRNDESHQVSEEAAVASTVKTPATCTEAGVTTYAATVEFNGHIYTDTKDVADIPATGHSYENGKCTVCSGIDPAFKAMIIEGANGKWQKGSEGGLSFTSNAAFADFQKVQVDGKGLDASKYTVEEGSTIVTLNASYLETLSAGKHTLAIVSDTGTAETEFTVVAAEEQAADDESANDKAANDGGKKSLAETGDGSMLPIAALTILVVASIAVGALALRRSRI